MACYEPVKQAVQKDLPEDKQYIGPMVAGVAAGLVSSLTRVPTEVIKSRLQTKEFAGVFQAVRSNQIAQCKVHKLVIHAVLNAMHTCNSNNMSGSHGKVVLHSMHCDRRILIRLYTMLERVWGYRTGLQPFVKCMRVPGM